MDIESVRKEFCFVKLKVDIVSGNFSGLLVHSPTLVGRRPIEDEEAPGSASRKNPKHEQRLISL